MTILFETERQYDSYYLRAPDRPYVCQLKREIVVASAVCLRWYQISHMTSNYHFWENYFCLNYYDIESQIFKLRNAVTASQRCDLFIDCIFGPIPNLTVLRLIFHALFI